ncbi:hypothetical protein KP77_25350 [Jeotgalibacillus alimentarius]|uniref:Uncharacterized protein n=1 Tax=Jeotgalibacillus alimentarius TaxID=135826 RepID=A0A0C2VR96_9BACL|nr:hypothetical protein [Jeotgalibacillus alimentarius]KIL46966.1 hypothetical protein KP77_25350 [Jeotgalibacillus alimentarius]
MGNLIGLDVENAMGHRGVILSYVKEKGRVRGFVVNYYDPKSQEYYKEYASLNEVKDVRAADIDQTETNMDSEFLHDLRYINRILAVRTNDRSWYEEQFK